MNYGVLCAEMDEPAARKKSLENAVSDVIYEANSKLQLRREQGRDIRLERIQFFIAFTMIFVCFRVDQNYLRQGVILSGLCLSIGNISIMGRLSDVGHYVIIILNNNFIKVADST